MLVIPSPAQGHGVLSIQDRSKVSPKSCILTEHVQTTVVHCPLPTAICHVYSIPVSGVKHCRTSRGTRILTTKDQAKRKGRASQAVVTCSWGERVCNCVRRLVSPALPCWRVFMISLSLPPNAGTAAQIFICVCWGFELRSSPYRASSPTH